jgi:hypothetical protein
VQHVLAVCVRRQRARDRAHLLQEEAEVGAELLALLGLALCMVDGGWWMVEGGWWRLKEVKGKGDGQWAVGSESACCVVHGAW